MNGSARWTIEYPQSEELVAADSNKDGNLDFEEYAAFAKQIQDRIANESPKATKPNAPEPEELDWATRQIAKYDRNGDGKLTTDEWTSMLVPPIAADTDGDGQITVEEYRKFRGR